MVWSVAAGELDAVIYINAAPGATPDDAAQEAACRALADRDGKAVVKVYRDDEPGGKRQAWEEMLTDVTSDEAPATIIAHSLSLLTPRVADRDRLIAAATEHGITITLTAAPHEGLRSEKTIAQQRDAAMAGKPKRGSRSYGYESDGETIREHEADIIKEMATRVLGSDEDGDGDSLRSIAIDLNERGEKTATGRGWQTLTVRRTLLAPRVSGRRAYRGVIVADGAWPAIISPATQDKIRAMLSDRTRKSSNKGSRLKYLLTGGLLTCGRCGATMGSQPSNTGRRGYVCRRTPPNLGCGRIRIQAEPLEDEVAQSVLAKLASPAVRNKMTAVLFVDADGHRLSEVIVELEQRLVDLGRDYADGVIGRTEFISARSRINERLRERRQMWARAMSLDLMPKGSVQALTEWWVEAPVTDRRAAVDLVLERIEVGPTQRPGFTGFDPDRLTWFWRF